MRFCIVFVVCNMVKTSLRYSGSIIVPEARFRVYDFLDCRFFGNYYGSIEHILSFINELHEAE